MASNSNAYKQRYLGKFALEKILTMMRHSIAVKIAKNGGKTGGISAVVSVRIATWPFWSK
ncbi:hypothetical protein C812_02331 [Paenibacillus barengoltzii G22]|uniref:Uncharacterized protein n=1 Tax=Paenibacillus barengoltzii G22 TaxID=1235795 RepID=R9LC25_9BACL|nr:hypothetical protein C812_02331 [Paenibacillus barengoltzii G22]